MEQHPPIKRHEALVEFSKDHHFGLLLVWKIRQGLAASVAPGRINDYILFCFEEDLQQHFSEEESLMFSKLDVDAPLRLQAEREHQLMYALVERIRMNRLDESVPITFANTLQDHIRFEERKLFNYLQEHLNPEDLATVASYHGTGAGDIDLRWSDRFWEKTKPA